MAFAAHLLDEDGDLHFSTCLDLEMTGNIRVGDLERDVCAGLAEETLAHLARGEQCALATSKRAVVDANLHRDRGRIDVHERQALALFAVGERFADEYILKACDADDVASFRLGDFDFLQSLVTKDSGDFCLGSAVTQMEADEIVADFHFAADDASVGETTEVFAIVQIRHDELEERLGADFWRRDFVHHGLVERLHGAALVLHVELRKAILGTCIDDREIELLVIGVEFEEELEDLIQHLVRVGVFAVNFVNDDDWFRTVLERLLQNELRLCLRAVVRVHHEEHAINHLHDALHLATEVGMSGRVHDVDVVAVPAERGVLCADGDALLAFEIHRVHDALLGRLGFVGAESSRLFEQAVNECGLAVIDVGDDGDIANKLL